LLRVLPSASTHTYSAKILSGGKGRAMKRSRTAGSSWDCPVLRSSMVNRCVELEVDDRATTKTGPPMGLVVTVDDDTLGVGTTNAPEGTDTTAKAMAAALHFMIGDERLAGKKQDLGGKKI
jgi:hypothetical protein